jgi:hypothetical protein
LTTLLLPEYDGLTSDSLLEGRGEHRQLPQTYDFNNYLTEVCFDSELCRIQMIFANGEHSNFEDVEGSECITVPHEDIGHVELYIKDEGWVYGVDHAENFDEMKFYSRGGELMFATGECAYHHNE